LPNSAVSGCRQANATSLLVPDSDGSREYSITCSSFSFVRKSTTNSKVQSALRIHFPEALKTIELVAAVAL
jgi:hypothetical protein